MTWMPRRNGHAIDLVDPSVDQVDFREMAHALANQNRYAGHGEIQVSVAHHVLIGLDLCPEPLKPHWLLHDGHEERLGEITRPAFDALGQVAAELIGEVAREAFKRTVREFKRRHDVVIHAAGGLPMPSPAQKQAIEAVDLRCLATEHRDFHRPSARKWAHEILGIVPAKRLRKWAPPDRMAEELFARFEHYLPALRERAPAGLFSGG